MSSKSITWIIVVVVVVVGGYFVYTGMSKSSPAQGSHTATSTDVTTTNSTETSGKKMAFSEFMKQGGSYQCTVNQDVGGTQSTGTVYISNGMVSGKFNTAVQGMNIDSNFVMKDGFSYTWTSMMPGKGFKIAVASNPDTGATGGSASGTYSFDASQIGDYNCVAWTADQSKFALPSGTVFTELKK